MSATFEVLLVEDSPDDVFLMERALKKAGLLWNLTVVMDGQEALDYVAGAGKFAQRQQFPIPSLVFLDLKLPYLSGFEVLAAIRQHPMLRAVPVVVLTSSPEQRDEQRAMQLGANAYCLKPPAAEMLRDISKRDWMASKPQTAAGC
jgi:CheY-like chemotaxis protein